MTTAVQPDPPPAPKLPTLLTQRTTYLLIPYDTVESRICRYAIEKRYGENLKAQVVTAIPVIRLTELHTVIPFVRKKMKPVSIRRPGPDGIPEEYPLTDDELESGVTECEALQVSKFWLEGGEDGGSLDRERFWPALNKRTAPFFIMFRADEGLIRLSLTP